MQTQAEAPSIAKDARDKNPSERVILGEVVLPEGVDCYRLALLARGRMDRGWQAKLTVTSLLRGHTARINQVYSQGLASQWHPIGWTVGGRRSSR
jgi:hypothetical protein